MTFPGLMQALWLEQPTAKGYCSRVISLATAISSPYGKFLASSLDIGEAGGLTN
jgi:hypothetical protein